MNQSLPATPRHSDAESRLDDHGAVERRAALEAAAKLKASLDRLRAQRAFEDEPAQFQAWIESHRDNPR